MLCLCVLTLAKTQYNAFIFTGGDLDGDLYFVTWSDDFKPRRDIHDPMNYPALEKKKKDGPITVEDMVEFYTEYIQCDALGKRLIFSQFMLDVEYVNK